MSGGEGYREATLGLPRVEDDRSVADMKGLQDERWDAKSGLKPASLSVLSMLRNKGDAASSDNGLGRVLRLE